MLHHWVLCCHLKELHLKELLVKHDISSCDRLSKGDSPLLCLREADFSISNFPILHPISLSSMLMLIRTI